MERSPLSGVGEEHINTLTNATAAADIGMTERKKKREPVMNAILCDVGEFHCHDQLTCVPENWLCDGEPDCSDASDETDTSCKSIPMPFLFVPPPCPMPHAH
ncbi:unnamed protein product [Arctogadus glacialis]